MRAKIITSNQSNFKIEIENGNDTLLIWETDDGNLAFKQQSENKDINILPFDSNSFEVEFKEKTIKPSPVEGD